MSLTHDIGLLDGRSGHTRSTPVEGQRGGSLVRCLAAVESRVSIGGCLGDDIRAPRGERRARRAHLRLHPAWIALSSTSRVSPRNDRLPSPELAAGDLYRGPKRVAGGGVVAWPPSLGRATDGAPSSLSPNVGRAAAAAGAAGGAGAGSAAAAAAAAAGAGADVAAAATGTAAATGAAATGAATSTAAAIGVATVLLLLLLLVLYSGCPALAMNMLRLLEPGTPEPSPTFRRALSDGQTRVVSGGGGGNKLPLDPSVLAATKTCLEASTVSPFFSMFSGIYPVLFLEHIERWFVQQ